MQLFELNKLHRNFLTVRDLLQHLDYHHCFRRGFELLLLLLHHLILKLSGIALGVRY